MLGRLAITQPAHLVDFLPQLVRDLRLLGLEQLQAKNNRTI